MKQRETHRVLTRRLGARGSSGVHHRHAFFGRLKSKATCSKRGGVREGEYHNPQDVMFSTVGPACLPKWKTPDRHVCGGDEGEHASVT